MSIYPFGQMISWILGLSEATCINTTLSFSLSLSLSLSLFELNSLYRKVISRKDKENSHPASQLCLLSTFIT